MIRLLRRGQQHRDIRAAQRELCRYVEARRILQADVEENRGRLQSSRLLQRGVAGLRLADYLIAAPRDERAGHAPEVGGAVDNQNPHLRSLAGSATNVDGTNV